LLFLLDLYVFSKMGQFDFQVKRQSKPMLIGLV
jgi:hypothetical protein